MLPSLFLTILELGLSTHIFLPYQLDPCSVLPRRSSRGKADSLTRGKEAALCSLLTVPVTAAHVWLVPDSYHWFQEQLVPVFLLSSHSWVHLHCITLECFAGQSPLLRGPNPSFKGSFSVCLGHLLEDSNSSSRVCVSARGVNPQVTPGWKLLPMFFFSMAFLPIEVLLIQKFLTMLNFVKITDGSLIFLTGSWHRTISVFFPHNVIFTEN